MSVSIIYRSVDIVPLEICIYIVVKVEKVKALAYTFMYQPTKIREKLYYSGELPNGMFLQNI